MEGWGDVEGGRVNGRRSGLGGVMVLPCTHA